MYGIHGSFFGTMPPSQIPLKGPVVTNLSQFLAKKKHSFINFGEFTVYLHQIRINRAKIGGGSQKFLARRGPPE
jgi:hypothetical protein